MNVVVVEPIGINEEKIENYKNVMSGIGFNTVFFSNRTDDEAELTNRVKDADIIIVANQPLRKNILEKAENLKMISVAFTGVDHIDIDYCRERNIIVSNSSGYSTNAVAELTLGLMISVYRDMKTMEDNTREGLSRNGFLGREITGKTVGVIGTGEIGKKVIRVLRAFDCNVLAYSRTEKDEIRDMGVKYTDLDTLMKESDIVTLHLPFTKESNKLISKEKIELMKDDAVIINTARGGIVDNEALAEALREGKIGGAGIDVYDYEPPMKKDYCLLDTKNSVLMPHIGYATIEAINTRAEIVFDNIIKWKDGNPQNLV